MFTDEFMQEYDLFVTSTVSAPADDDDFYFSPEIPGDRVESDCHCESGVVTYDVHLGILRGVFECDNCGRVTVQ